MSDFLGIFDLEPERLASLLAESSTVKRDPSRVAGALRGRSIGLFFMKPSTRTRVSSEVAAFELGAHPVVLGQDEVGLGDRESVSDVARSLDRYLDLLALRVFDHGLLIEMSRAAKAPVINLLSDLEHPCQALADLQTIEEHRMLAGTVLAYVGDGNNVCHSLMVAAAMAQMEVRVATPSGYEPQARFVDRAATFSQVRLFDEPMAAVAGADVVYTDVWASMGQETEQSERFSRFEAFRVDDRVFSSADQEAIFLHCLPAHRGEEVTPSVIDGPRSRVFDQAENRLHTFKALLLHYLG